MKSKCYAAILSHTRDGQLRWSKRVTKYGTNWIGEHRLYTVTTAQSKSYLTPGTEPVSIAIRVKAAKVDRYIGLTGEEWELLHWNIYKRRLTNTNTGV